MSSAASTVRTSSAIPPPSTRPRATVTAGHCHGRSTSPTPSTGARAKRQATASKGKKSSVWASSFKRSASGPRGAVSLEDPADRVARGLRARGAGASCDEDPLGRRRAGVEDRDRAPRRRRRRASGQRGAEGREDEAPAAHPLASRVPEVQADREGEPSDGHVDDRLEGDERVAADHPQHARSEDEAERGELDARGQPHAGGRPPRHEEAAEVRQDQQAHEHQDGAHGLEPPRPSPMPPSRRATETASARAVAVLPGLGTPDTRHRAPSASSETKSRRPRSHAAPSAAPMVSSTRAESFSVRGRG